MPELSRFYGLKRLLRYGKEGEMYIVDGIAYAGENENSVKVLSVRPLDDYRLWLRFSTGETRVFDFAPLLNAEGFRPLMDKASFNNVYVDYGITVWNDGEIDIAPEYLYENSISA